MCAAKIANEMIGVATPLAIVLGIGQPA